MDVHHLAGLRLSAPTDAELMRDAFDRPLGERRLAYWARLWPSGAVLARLVVGELAPRLRGRAVIELGCGLAAAGLAAARAGADVLLTDGEAEALAVAEANARANGITVRCARVTWSRIPDALAGRFDVVLGADLAYDRDQLAPLAGAIHTLLAPGGEAWLADPGRLGADVLPAAARDAGLDVAAVQRHPQPDDVPPADGGEPHDIDVYRLVVAGAPG